MWSPQIDSFSKTNTVLNIDLRGFGKSSLPTSDYSHYHDLKNILEFLNLKRVHLVGLSMGGRVALDYTLTYPQNVLSLTLLDSSLGGYKSTVDWTITVKNDDKENAKRDWISHPVFEYSNKNAFTRRTLLEILYDYSCWHWIHPKKFEYAIPEAKDRLDEIRTKTVIGVGEHDLGYFHDIVNI